MTGFELQIATVDLTGATFIAAAFHAFDAQHIITLIVIAILCSGVAWAAKKIAWARRKWLDRGAGFLLSGYVVCVYVQQGLTHSLTWEYSLPLELCSLVLFACIITLFRPIQIVSEIAYFWGLGGVLQATLTPDIALGFPSWDFILFFWGHGATLMAIVLLIAHQDFRPRKGSILRMQVVLNVYALIVGSVNAVAGWNYGYLCRKPAAPSLLDYLGPWPWYLLSLEVVALLYFFLLYTPWRLFTARTDDSNCRNHKNAI